MTYLDDLRVRERARARSRTWAAHTSGTSGMPMQMLPMGLSNAALPLASTYRVDSTMFPTGVTVTVARDSQAIPTDGATVAWDRKLAVPIPAGYDGYDPGPTIPIPINGYYDFHVKFKWDTFTGGGTVVARVDGAEVGRSFAEFGVEFNQVFPLGVLAVGSEVSLTVDHGVSSSYTLVDAQATCQLVEPAVLVEPWAHFEPANLASYSDGDPVTLWTDTTSNGRDLTNGSTIQEPTLVVNALNGLPGIFLGGDSLFDVRTLDVDVAAEDVDRVTFLAVVAQVDENLANESSIVTLRGATDVGLYFYREPSNYDMSVSAAEESAFFFATSNTAPLNVAGGLLLEAERTPDGVTLKVGGATVASDSSGSGTAPPAAASTINNLIVGDTGPARLVLCELVVFVTPEEHALVAQYRSLLQSRWGL